MLQNPNNFLIIAVRHKT